MEPIDLSGIPVEAVAIDALRDADSPRVAGEDQDHIRDLIGIYEQLPPILVHRSTMRVIDGMHRLRAARERGEAHVKIRFVEGDEADVFVLAVRTNVVHGLPLSMDDKRKAVSRIIGLCPDWSDRRIASVCCVSAKVVATLRDCPADEQQQLDKRVGRDGKARPVNSAERREKVRELLRERPESSLREIAEKADVSPETVRSIRTAMRAGSPQREAPGTGQQRGDLDCSAASCLHRLKNDPAVRSNEVGRQLLQFLGISTLLAHDPAKITENLPEYAMPWITEAVRDIASAWLSLAGALGNRAL